MYGVAAFARKINPIEPLAYHVSSFPFQKQVCRESRQALALLGLPSLLGTCYSKFGTRRKQTVLRKDEFRNDWKDMLVVRTGQQHITLSTPLQSQSEQAAAQAWALWQGQQNRRWQKPLWSTIVPGVHKSIQKSSWSEASFAFPACFCFASLMTFDVCVAPANPHCDVESRCWERICWRKVSSVGG